MVLTGSQFEVSVDSGDYVRRHPKVIRRAPARAPKTAPVIAGLLTSGDSPDSAPSLPPASNESLPRWLENCQRARVPEVVLKHIQSSPELILESARMSSIGLGGKAQEVREMVISDFTGHAARGAYEITQGIEDHGFLDQDKPDWVPPSVKIHKKDGVVEKYHGANDFGNTKAIIARNYGATSLGSITEWGGDKSDFVSNEKPHGMWGRGWKISLTSMVSNPQDRRNVAGLYLKESMFVSEESVPAIENYIDSPVPVLGEESFAYVQALDPHTGKYFRVYAYRVPSYSNNIDMWTMQYAIFDLDESRIPAEDRHQVITAHINPDEEQARMWEDLSWNHLLCNPYYPSAKSLVREVDDARPLAEITHYNKDNTPLGFAGSSIFKESDWQMEEIKWPPGIMPPANYTKGIYAEGLLLQSSSHNWDGSSILSWNLSTVRDPSLYRVIHREHDSIHVSGEPELFIRSCVATWKDAAKWGGLIQPFINTDATSADLAKFVETTAFTNSLGYLPFSTQEAIGQAFLDLCPEAQGQYYFNEKYLTLWQLLHPDSSAVPAHILKEISAAFPRSYSGSRSSSKFHDCDQEIEIALTQDRSLYSSDLDFRVIEGVTSSKFEKSSDFELTRSLLGHPQIDFVENAREYTRDSANSLHFVVNYDLDDSEISLGRRLVARPDRTLEQILVSLAQRGYVVEFFTEENIDPNSPWNTKSTCTTTKNIDGHQLVVYGKANQNRSSDEVPIERNALTIKISSPISAERMNDLVKDLDQYVTGIHPEAIKQDERTLKLIAEQLDYLKAQVSKSQEELNAIRSKVYGSLVSVERKPPSTREGSARLEGTLLARNRLRDQEVDNTILASSFGREHLYESFYETPDWTPTGEYHHSSRGRVDYGITTVSGSKLPLYIEIDTSSRLRIKPKYGVLGDVRSKSWELISTVHDESVWKAHHPEDGALYNHSRSGEGLDYQAIVTTQAPLIVRPGENAILPVPKGWQITHISLPTNDSATQAILSQDMKVPLLFYDRATRHTVIQNRVEKGVKRLDHLPIGTRIYIRPIPAQNDVINEEFLRKEDPDYYSDINETLIDPNKLDADAQRFIVLCNSLPLSREQRFYAVKKFWENRRIYDDTTAITSLEDVVIDGRGVCRRAGLGELALLRAVKIPCQLTSNYDNSTGGTLAPPYHVLIEWLDDKGQWQVEEPPNSRMSQSFADMLAYQTAHSQLPFVHDAHMFNRPYQGNTPTLPPVLDNFLESNPVVAGAPMPSSLSAILTELNRHDYVYVNRAQQDILGALAEFPASPDFDPATPTPRSYDEFEAVARGVYQEYVQFFEAQQKAHGKKAELLRAGIAELFAIKLAKMFGFEADIGGKAFEILPLSEKTDARVDRAFTHILKTEGLPTAFHFLFQLMTHRKGDKLLNVNAALDAAHRAFVRRLRITRATATMDIERE